MIPWSYLTCLCTLWWSKLCFCRTGGVPVLTQSQLRDLVFHINMHASFILGVYRSVRTAGIKSMLLRHTTMYVSTRRLHTHACTPINGRPYRYTYKRTHASRILYGKPIGDLILNPDCRWIIFLEIFKTFSPSKIADSCCHLSWETTGTVRTLST